MIKRIALALVTAFALIGSNTVPAQAAGSVQWYVSLENNPGGAGAYLTGTKPVSSYIYVPANQTYNGVKGFKSLSYCTLVSQWGYRYPKGVWIYVSATASGLMFMHNDCAA